MIVTDVKLNSNAEKFGFIKSDIIVQIENLEVNTLKDIKLISKKLGAVQGGHIPPIDESIFLFRFEGKAEIASQFQRDFRVGEHAL